jgi:hypothetical protein
MITRVRSRFKLQVEHSNRITADQSYQKMSVVKVVFLVNYCLNKIIFRKMQLIFGIENLNFAIFGSSGT